MFKNRNIFYIFLIIAVAAVFYYEHRKLDSNLSLIESNLVGEKNRSRSASDQPGITKIETDQKPDQLVASADSASAASAVNFPVWFSEEAKNLEASTKNPAEKEALLKNRAQQLAPEEIIFLRKKATDVKASANERISATYLLTLNSSNESLMEIAKVPLSLPTPQPVHSVGETLLMQEKAIRVMAIDELFNRAKSDAALRQQLFATINLITNEGLKHYALKRYQELK